MAIYKICPAALWRKAEDRGRFEGSGIDHADGYIHFSTATQVADTARLHFAGQRDLVLIAVNEDLLGEALRYEPSRGGELFPHLYDHLRLDRVLWVRPMPLGDDGLHLIPEPLE